MSDGRGNPHSLSVRRTQKLWCGKGEQHGKKVRFDSTVEELALIRRCVDRYKKLKEGIGQEIVGGWELDVTMTLDAVNSNGTPIDFQKLLTAYDFSFVHDMDGMEKHIDKNTGKLTGFFLPRSAR